MAENQKEAQPESAEAVEVEEEKGLLEQIIDEGRLAREPTQRGRAKDLVSEFVAQITEGEMLVSRDTEAMINARISQIDKLISDQLNEVMHHPDLPKMKASWRVLHETWWKTLASKVSWPTIVTSQIERKPRPARSRSSSS